MPAAAVVVGLLLQVAPVPAAQPTAPPPTDVYLLAVDPAGEGTLRLGTPENISLNPGYDNQPFFTRGGEALLFTSMRDGRQTDIYEYAIATRALTRLTETPESEYSPTPAPDGRISVVRVEADNTQRLWAFSAGGGRPSLLLAEVKPVGYHAWADPNTLVLFVLGDPPTLRIADLRSGKAEVIASRPGRCLAQTPGGKVSFVQKGPGTESWKILELDPSTKALTPLTETLAGREDYAWLPDGRLLMASGSKVFLWKKDAPAWREVADLASATIANITRLAVSPDGKRLALVAEIASH